MDKKTLVLSMAPYNFAGAAMANLSALEIFATLGATVSFYSQDIPFRAPEMYRVGIRTVLRSGKSDAYPLSDYVNYGILVEQVIFDATNWLNADPNNKIVLYATYLFPFCMAMETAARILHSSFAGRIKCIITPAGSDIWQIGRQAPSVTKHLLESSVITRVVTYSDQFRNEIIDSTKINRPIFVIPPAIDTNKYHPITREKKIKLRITQGIGVKEFVIAHCSNNRPIKGLGHTLEIVWQFAKRSKISICLLLIGPVTEHLKYHLSQYGCSVENDTFIYRKQIENLKIICVGLRNNVHHWNVISDVAINTSLHDSFNISLGEFMACEIPILTTDVVGISKIIKEFNCGMVFPFSYNPIALDLEYCLPSKTPSKINLDNVVEWLEMISQDECQRRQLGEQGRMAIEKYCSYPIIMEQWQNLCCFSDENSVVERCVCHE